MKKIKTLKLVSSTCATLGGTPYDVIANGENIGTIAVVDRDDIVINTRSVLINKGFTIDPYKLYMLTKEI